MSGGGHSYQEKKTEFLKWQLGYLIDQIKMADNKIYFLLAIYLVFLGLTISQVEKMIDIFSNTSICCIWKVIIGIICLCFLYYIVKFFHHFVNTIKPRTNPQEILGEKDYKSFIFWKDIANMGYDSFRDATLETRYSDLEKQVFVNSFIAKAKFENVTNAYKFLVPTMIFLLIFFILIRLVGG